MLELECLNQDSFLGKQIFLVQTEVARFYLLRETLFFLEAIVM